MILFSFEPPDAELERLFDKLVMENKFASLLDPILLLPCLLSFISLTEIHE